MVSECNQLVEKTTLKLETMEIEGPIKTNLISTAKSLFDDNHMIYQEKGL